MIKLPKMHVISCAKTTDAVIERRKTVTRRWGWKHARVGMILRVVDRLRYRDTDPPQVTLACVEIVDVSCVDCTEFTTDRSMSKLDYARESLEPYSKQGLPALWKELSREGLGGMSAREFEDLLASMAPADYYERGLTRIEWVYREDLFEAWKEQR